MLLGKMLKVSTPEPDALGMNAPSTAYYYFKSLLGWRQVT